MNYYGDMYILGIHPDGDYFKVALLGRSGKRIRIHFLQEFKKDILDLNQLKRKILKMGDVEVVSALTPEEVFVKKVSFPFTQKRAVLKALPFQLEKILPFSEEHVSTVPLIRKKKKESEVTLYTFFNEVLQAHLQEIKTLGFDPDLVSTVSRGLFQFKKFFVGAEPGGVLYFGWEKSYVIYVDHEEVKHSLAIGVGFRELIDAARGDYPNIESIDYPFLKEEIVKYFQKDLEGDGVKVVLEKLQKGLFRAFEYIRKKENIDLLPILHLGYSSISEEMTRAMTDVPTKFVEIIPHLEFDGQQIRSYAIEIGIALASLDKEPLQLRVGQFASGKALGKLQGKITLLLGMAALSGIIVFSSTSAFFLKKCAVLKERFNYVASLMGREELNRNLYFSGYLQEKIQNVFAKTREKEPLRLSEWFQAFSDVRVSEVNYEEGKRLEVKFLADSQDVAKKVLEKVGAKEFERIKDSNVYQVVITF